jgi:hypothetical protein
MPPNRRRRMGGRPRRFGARDPLPEPNDLWDFSDDDEDDPEEGDPALDEAAEAFTARTGVRLHHRLPDQDDDDEGRREDKGPVEPRVALRALPVIGRTLMLYPTELRGGLLRHLHVYGRFVMGGKPFLGCALPKHRRINLPIRTKTPLASLESTMHHEIGHMVEMHPDFPERRWVQLSRGPYTGAGHRDLEGRRAGPELWELGFITRYGSKNRHEDFAELAEAAFTETRKVRRLAREHAAIGEKLELMGEVYSRMLPGLDLPWTRREE